MCKFIIFIIIYNTLLLAITPVECQNLTLTPINFTPDGYKYVPMEKKINLTCEASSDYVIKEISWTTNGTDPNKNDFEIITPDGCGKNSVCSTILSVRSYSDTDNFGGNFTCTASSKTNLSKSLRVYVIHGYPRIIADIGFESPRAVHSNANITLECEAVGLPGTFEIKWSKEQVEINSQEMYNLKDDWIEDYRLHSSIDISLDKTEEDVYSIFKCETIGNDSLSPYESDSRSVTLIPYRIENTSLVIEKNTQQQAILRFSYTRDDPEICKIEWKFGNEDLIVGSKYYFNHTVNKFEKSFDLFINHTTSEDSGRYEANIKCRDLEVDRKSICLTILAPPIPTITAPVFCAPGAYCDVEYKINGDNVSLFYHVTTCSNNGCEENNLKDIIIKLNDDDKKDNAYIGRTKIAWTIGLKSINFIARNDYGDNNITKEVHVTTQNRGLGISGDEIVAKGYSFTLTCMACRSYFEGKKMLWYVNGNGTETNTKDEKTSNIQIYTSNSDEYDMISYLTVRNVTNEMEGDYTCEVEHSNETRFHSIVVHEPLDASIIDSNLRNRTVHLHASGNKTLRCTAKGLPVPTITWFKDSESSHQIINSSHTLINIIRNNKKKTKFSKLIIFDVNDGDAGRYRCLAENDLRRVERYVILKKENSFGDYITYIIALPVLLCLLLAGCCGRAVTNKIQKREKALMQYDGRLSFPREQVEMKLELGKGQYSQIWSGYAKGLYGDSETFPVVIKTVLPKSTKRERFLLKAEHDSMVQIGQHTNIVNILRACNGRINGRESLMLVYDPIRYGNLHAFLCKYRSDFQSRDSMEISSIGSVRHSSSSYDDGQTGSRRIQLDIRSSLNSNRTKLADDVPTMPGEVDGHEDNCPFEFNANLLDNWAYQIAEGMKFLSKKQIIHRDLAARNIWLLDRSLVKIGDYAQYENNIIPSYMSTKPIETSSETSMPWSSIEVLKNEPITIQSNIWSFGIVMWELFSLARTPYEGLVNIRDLIISGHRLSKPEYANDEVFIIMKECWEEDPARRPCFRQLSVQIAQYVVPTDLGNYQSECYANMERWRQCYQRQSESSITTIQSSPRDTIAAYRSDCQDTQV